MLKRLEDSFGKSVLSNIALNGVPQDLDSAIALANKQDDRTRKEFEKWAILTYSNNRAIINEKKGADKGIDGTAFILHTSQETREVIFSVKSGNLGVSQIRDLRGVIERENAAIGILIVLEEPTKPMLQECKQAGVYENEIMHQSFERLQIVTVREILEGKRLSLPMSLEVVKSAERKGQEIKQKSIFE
jgi:site-specific DNA-methyltransferase (adenine-specific)